MTNNLRKQPRRQEDRPNVDPATIPAYPGDERRVADRRAFKYDYSPELYMSMRVVFAAVLVVSLFIVLLFLLVTNTTIGR